MELEPNNSEVINKVIICQLCSKPFDDPRILSCLHSFCLQCLHHEIEKSGSQQMFQCPICEQNTNIPVGGASVLPQNLHLGFEVEVAGYMSKMVNNSHPQEGPDHFPHSKPTQHISVSVKTDDLVTQLSKLGEIIVFFPSPSSSTWMSTSVARVGTRYHVKVQSKTSKGEEYPHGGVEVKGEMRSKTHNGAVVYGEVEDHRDGTYTITLTPQTAGPHQLLITMDGQHVQNSPNDLDVRPKRDYRTLCNDQQVIQCKAPFCVAIHDNGDIYVGSDDHCIYMFDQTGHLKNTIGSSGSGDGQFSSPYGIFIKGDVLYVADYGNHRVQKLTSSGKFLHKFGQQGSGQGQFNGPVGVIIDSNNKLIVSDFNNHRIQIFNENGGWLLTIDGNGTGNHSFQYPWGLALDPQGNIHVAAHGSNTIVFSKEGVYVRMYGDPNGPRGLAIDGEGYSLVSETHGHCLSIYDPEGNKIHTVGNLKNPWGTALDPRDGSVFIANYGANTVLKYCV
ncbi:hypothetical protein EMCRGX_G013139 [Ephydatia muelleri]